MKSILIIVLTLLPLSSFSASGCFGVGKNEIEMLELTYMTEKELIDEYCFAYNSMKGFEKLGRYSESLIACSEYSERIFKVLRKDHRIKSVERIKCPEWEEEIEKEKENKVDKGKAKKVDKGKAKEDFLLILDLYNESFNSGKMDKAAFNARLYRVLHSLEKKGVYTPKELREIEAANLK